MRVCSLFKTFVAGLLVGYSSILVLKPDTKLSLVLFGFPRCNNTVQLNIPSNCTNTRICKNVAPISVTMTALDKLVSELPEPVLLQAAFNVCSPSGFKECQSPMAEQSWAAKWFRSKLKPDHFR